VICTDISKDGLLEGSSIDLYVKIMNRFPELKLIASGGVTDVSELDKYDVAGMIELSNICRKNSIHFYCVTSSLMKDIMKFEVKQKAMFNYLFADEVLIETINRGNPGLTVLKEGTILAKYNHFDLPSKEIVKDPLSYTIKEKAKREHRMIVLISGLLLTLTVIILYKKQ
jgi:hypothetical protein